MRRQAAHWLNSLASILRPRRAAAAGGATAAAAISPDANGPPPVDAEMESFIGPIPTLPDGPDGHALLRRTFLELIDVLHPVVLCDIGANDGGTACDAKRMSPGLEVHAFEANPRIHAAHAAACVACGVHWHHLAVADHAGVVPIYMPRTLSRAYVNGAVVPMAVNEPENTGKSSLLLRDEDATYEQFDVRAVTLDEFLAGKRPVDGARNAFLWIDVEGAADRVLAGAAGVLQSTVAVFVEIEGFRFWRGQGHGGRVIASLRQAGFVPLARDREYADKQFNVLLVHGSALPLVQDALAEGMLSIRGHLEPAEAFPLHRPAGPDERRPERRWPSCAASLSGDIPVLVPCFNNPTYTARMHGQLRRIGMRRIVYIDDGSTLPEMVSLLEELSSEATVVAAGGTFGPRFAFLDPATYALLPRRFCITDPDLEFHPALPPDFLGELAVLIERHRIGKAGFALDLSDRHEMDDRRYQIGDGLYRSWEWERRFWAQPVDSTAGGDRVYEAPIDTTFALYDKHHFDPAHQLRGLRVAGRYTARHLPWYRSRELPDEEARVYRQTQRHSFYFPCREAG
jgi:FkbM family methyltransferase